MLDILLGERESFLLFVCTVVKNNGSGDWVIIVLELFFL
jgi:hypothetical protein